MPRKSKKSVKKADPQSEGIAAPETSPAPPLTSGIEDPIGDVSSGEGHIYLGDERSAGDVEAPPPNDDEPESAHASAEGDSDSEEVEAELQSENESEVKAEEEDESAAEPQPASKLERLQKILSQAGIASRRHAEEMITAGRVQVNGAVVTELGSKADAARDHIRVDGKLLHGAERHRYFVLNKPKGFVTTVSDPEGRPTVMQFFEKTRERLYPVGRLDYQSEGLLLMTNDGELANRLTRAGSGVEKTYLVKIAGNPTEEELETLRLGVAIERGEPGSKKVHTAPARIRQVRQGDNPWYEVVLIEGRNRELRKMFSAIGHFVEKIRRVGYGPLVLDVEPGKLRELTLEEIANLRLAAEGKLPKRTQHTPRPNARFSAPPARSTHAKGEKQRGPRDWDRGSERGRPSEHEREDRRENRPGDRAGNRSEGRFGQKAPRSGHARKDGFRPDNQRNFSSRPPESRRDFAGRSGRGTDKPRSDNPRFEGKSRQDKPAWMRDTRAERPRGKRPFPAGDRGDSRFGDDRPSRGRSDRFSDRSNRQFGENRARRERPDRFSSDRPTRSSRETKAPFTRDRYSNRSEEGESRGTKPGFGKFRAKPEERDKQKAAGKSFGPGQRDRFQPKGKPARNNNPKSGPRGPIRSGRPGRSDRRGRS